MRRLFLFSAKAIAQYNFQPNEVEFPALLYHIVTLNLGEEGDLFRQKDGREDKTAIAILLGSTAVAFGHRERD